MRGEAAHSTESPAIRIFRALLVCSALGVFWWPAARVAGGFPAPLDDVYIYFDFARSTAKGCFLCWTADTGYSSGATSPLYALVLALGYGVGFRGMALGWFAALVAVLSLYDATGSIFRLTRRRVIGISCSLLFVSIPLLGWSFASGMEVAFVACLVGRAACAVSRAADAPPATRAPAQWRAGGWLLAIAMARPECVPLAFCFGVAVAHAAGSLRVLPSLARALGPTAFGLAALYGANLAFTGEAEPAGALRKLISSDPFASGNDVGLMMIIHAVRLGTEGVELAVGGPMRLRALVLVSLVGVLHRRSRRVGLSLLIGAAAALLLATLNKTAPFQNLRYVAPTLFMLLLASVVGATALATRFRNRGWLVAPLLALFVMSGSLAAFPRQREHFARAAKNIREQQVEVGLRLAALEPAPSRVFVGDAGAIPYVSGLPALDGLGLGGDHHWPFARASVHGPAAVIELIERMPAHDRPDVLAIYDSWWPDVGRLFGDPLFEVAITDNVICGDPKKSVYRARWSLLEDRSALESNVLDRIDVGDLLAERERSARFTTPHAGYVFGSTLRDASGELRFDAVRSFGEGQFFELLPLIASKEKRDLGFELVSDSPTGTSFQIERDSATPVSAVLARQSEASWAIGSAELPAFTAGERLRIVAGPGGLRIGSISLRPSAGPPRDR